MSPHHGSFTIRPLSSNSKKLSLVDQSSIRPSLHSRGLPPRKQRFLPSLSKRSVALAKFNTQYYQAMMAFNSALRLQDPVGHEQPWNISSSDAIYTDYISTDPGYDEEYDDTCESPLTSGSASTTSSEPSYSSSIHSASTEGSAQITYSPDSTYDQAFSSDGERPLRPAGNPPPRTLSGSSGEPFFICPCGREIQHRRNVKRHEKTCKLTQGKEKYPCELCGKEFAREDIRDRHRDGDGVRDSACWPLDIGSEQSDETES